MKTTILTLILVAGLGLAGCATPTDAGTDGTPQGSLKQAGSSTVYPIAEAWAEDLSKSGLQVTVAGGGSGAGASKLCAKEIDIGDLSRKIKSSEIASCQANGVEPTEWIVAFDGLTVVVSSENTFVDQLTIPELKRLWASGSDVTKWSDLRPGWPERTVRLYGPDSDSGTYEYFAEEVLGKSCGTDGKTLCAPRSDYTPSADDNVLVEGVSASEDALGYFGFAYFLENQDRLKAVPIVAPDSTVAVTPTLETIRDGSYAPFSRPLFMYTNGVPADGTPLHTYFEHAFGPGQEAIEDVGYVRLDAATLAKMTDRL